MECSLVTVGASARPDAQGRLHDVRIAFGALGPTPLRGRATEAALEGRRPDAETQAAARAAARGEVRPISDQRASAAYRLDLTEALLARALRRLSGEAPPRPRSAWMGFRGGAESPTAAPRDLPPGTSAAAPRRVVRFTLNDERVEAEVEPRLSLVDLLRDRFGLLGTKVGCGAGECGTCTVLLDGAAVNACLVLAIACDGVTIRTIEGLRAGEGLAPLQQAFVSCGAVQCGFCTPGMILEAHWLRSLGLPLEESLVRRGIEGNLCRCTGYQMIVEAIQATPPPAQAKDRAPHRPA
jgi:carbon-monoxide dehydrogenase small subunit